MEIHWLKGKISINISVAVLLVKLGLVHVLVLTDIAGKDLGIGPGRGTTIVHIVKVVW